jgi:hypothetical protein
MSEPEFTPYRGVEMSTFVERIRARRELARRHNAIERAIAKNPSQALRQELTAMMTRN